MRSLDLSKECPLSVTAQAAVSYAELGLDFDLCPVRRGIQTILRSERGAHAPLGYEPSPLEVFAFTLAAAPQLTARWTKQLLSVVRRHQAGRSSFTVTDRQNNNVQIIVVDNVIEQVLPTAPQPSSNRRG